MNLKDKLKFNPGDLVYVIHDNSIVRDIVNEINIAYTADSFSIQYRLLKLNYNFPEKRLFISVDEIPITDFTKKEEDLPF